MTKAQALALLMFAIFLATSFRKGLTRNETDFPNYYTAAVLVRQGAPLRDYYDFTWFQQQMDHAGIQDLGSYLPQTPLTMVPMVPFANFSVQTAKQIWLVLNLLFLAATLWMLSRATQIPIEYLAILMFLGYSSLQSNFRLGQYYVFLLFLLTLAFYALHRRMSFSGGFICGVAFGLKLYGGPFLLYFLVKRDWKAVAGMLAASTLAVVTAIALFGWGDVRFYATQIFPRSLAEGVSDPYNPGNATLTTLFRHSFLMEPDLNSHPLSNAPGLFFFLRTFTPLVVLVYTLFSLASEGEGFNRRGFAWFSIAILLLSSSVSSYTYFLLLLPVALLLEGAGPKERIYLIASYIALNLFLLPSWTRFFPKLFILFALYMVEGRHYWRAFRPKIVAFGLLFATSIAAFVAERDLQQYWLEPSRHFQRLAVDKGTYLSAYPVVTSAGLFYEAMVRDGYVLRWSHDGRMEELAFGGQVFHPVAPSAFGPIYFELVKNGVSSSMMFEPATRQAVAVSLPPETGNSVISPDGKWIAVESTQPGPKQIWVRETLTGRNRLALAGNCNYSSPAWENANSLVFASDCGRGLGMPVLYRANIL